MACTFYRTRRRSLPPSRGSSGSWWMPTAVLLSVSAAVASAFQASPSSHHHPATTPVIPRLCRGEAYRATGSWSCSQSVEARPAGLGSQRQPYRSDPAAPRTALASMAPGTGVMAPEEDDRTRCVCKIAVDDKRKSHQQPAIGRQEICRHAVM